MSKTLSITEARSKLMEFPEELNKSPELGAVTITRRGKPVLAILSWELHEAIIETLEVLGDDDLMLKLRQSIQEVQEQKLLPWEEVKKDLGL